MEAKSLFVIMSLEFTKCYENNNSKKPLNLLSITCYVILDSYLKNKKNKKNNIKITAG